MNPGEQNELTIDELARETGMTVRNIRAHQSRGLLPPPAVRARTGYYGEQHIMRLRRIRQMQADGFNLTAIQRLLDRTDGAGDEALDFGRVALGAFSEEQPVFLTASELERRFGRDPETMRKAESLGLVRALPDGRFEFQSPTLLYAGEQLVSLGIPVARALAVVETVQRNSQATAREFVRLFMEDVAGSDRQRTPRSGEEWERLRAALERLTPLATDALRATFQQTMRRAVEEAVEQMLAG